MVHHTVSVLGSTQIIASVGAVAIVRSFVAKSKRERFAGASKGRRFVFVNDFDWPKYKNTPHSPTLLIG